MATAPSPDPWQAVLAAPVDADDRRLIGQAASLFEHAGVHLLDRRAQGVDPVAPLRRLHAQPPADRAELYRSLLAIYAAFGDRHSRCLLPPQWSSRFAYLPLLVGACAVRGRMALHVTASANPLVRRGDRLIAWNGRPIAAVLDAYALWQLGANPDARLAKAVQTLTVRPLALLPPPSEPADLLLETPKGERRVRLQWQVGDGAALAHALGRCTPPPSGFEPAPGGLQVRSIAAPFGPIGWIRIASLRAAPADLLPRFAALLERQPQSGLVLDLRGCEEGYVQTGERMLRLFADRDLPPLPFELRSTEWMRRLVHTCPAMAEWHMPVEAARSSGAAYTAGRPLTLPETLERPARRYAGPLLVLVDALTYSTAEMFAASVQDHRLGKVLGVAPRTGGGGAVAWSQDLVYKLSGDALFARRAGAASLRIAALRCRRTGASAGRLIEGEGVVPDLLHHLTYRDLFDGEADLVDRVIQTLGAMR